MSGFPSPFAPPSVNGVAATPSPIKKKLSLSDYKSRLSRAAAARPSIGTTLLKPVSNSDDPKSATSVDTGSSPIAERLGDTTDATSTSITTTTTTTTGSGPV
jgi:hypothetical protein